MDSPYYGILGFMHTTVMARVWVETNYCGFEHLRSLYAVMKIGMFLEEQKDAESAGFCKSTC